MISHNTYQNIRTRTVVLHDGHILLIPTDGEASHNGSHGRTVWRPPGGGLEPDETLAECARREVLEETGISVRVGRIVFVREWVVPKHTQPPEAPSGHGFGLEVYHYAWPDDDAVEPRPEKPGGPVAR